MHLSRYSTTTFTAFLLTLGAILGHTTPAQAELSPDTESASVSSDVLAAEAIATVPFTETSPKDLSTVESATAPEAIATTSSSSASGAAAGMPSGGITDALISELPIAAPDPTANSEATTLDAATTLETDTATDATLQPQDAILLSEAETASTSAIDLLRGANPVSSPVVMEEFDPDLLAQVPDITQGNSFSVQPDSGMEFPTALISSMRPRVTRLPIKRTGLALIASMRQPLSDNAYINLGLEGGERIAAFDLELVFEQEDDPRQGFGVNFFNQRSFHPAFSEGDPEVDLPDGNTPRIHRLGGGVEYFMPLGDVFESAFGVTYERVSVRDDLFTSDVETIDEFGNQLVADGDGIDDILTFSAAFELDDRDVLPFPTSGSHLRMGIDQSFNLGSNDIAYTRLNAFFTQYIPLDLFGFTAGPRTLIFNVQTGTMFGDVPPYAAFNLGGQNSIRGYSGGEVGTGTSFIQASLEYRFPVFNISLFRQDIPFQGVLFVDYGTDFGTGDEVIGEPAEVRNKPGDGLGYGLGIQTRGPFGFLGRLEFAINDEGDTDVIATVGDRF